MYRLNRALGALRRPSIAVVRVLVPLLALSCGGGQQPPPRIARVAGGAHVLQARATTEAPVDVHGPVRVLSHSPEGKTDGHVEVSAIFDRPMIALDRADATHAPAIRFSPPVNAEERWLGTRVVTFVPTAPLAAATRYTVTVPSGTRAIDGNTVAADVQWTFSTPRPTVAQSDPPEG